MGKRPIAGGLWFLAATYAGSMLHGIVGLPEIIGPAIGALTGALIVVDPFNRLAARDLPARTGLELASMTAPIGHGELDRAA